MAQGSRTAIEVQRDLAPICGYSNEIFWDLLSQNQDDILKEKIRSLIPDPSNVGERMRTSLFDSVWAQRKYTNRNSLSAIFYVLVTNTDASEALTATEFSCHPVFRTRKCTADSNSSNCCMIYVDEFGRVYQNWAAYLANNVLPQGIMITPQFGVYNFNGEDVNDVFFKIERFIFKIPLKVILYCGPTPASSTTTQVLETADRAFALGGMASVAIAVASICSLPVAAPIMAAGAGAGLVSAGYSSLRSGSALWDRSTHEQSISLTDRQARNSWLSVACSFVGFGASAATGALARSAAAGNDVSTITRVVANGMNVTSCVFAGGGVANSILDMFLKNQDDEDITALDVVQLAASLVMFTHSVNNFRSAQSIVQEAQNGRIQSYREGLSNRQRKMFDKMAKETMRIRGTDRGRIDVIRSVREMPTRQFLNDLHRINRQMNSRNVRPAFGGAENPVVLNNDLAVDTGVLRNSVQHNVGPDVLSQVTQPIPDSHFNVRSNALPTTSTRTTAFQTRVFVSGSSNGSNLRANTGFPRSQTEQLLLKNIALFSGIIITFASLGSSLLEHIRKPEGFEKEVLNIAREFTDEVFYEILEMANEFIDGVLSGIENSIQIEIPSEIIMRRLHEIVQQYNNTTLDFIQSKGIAIMKSLRQYFSSTDFRQNFVQEELHRSLITLRSGVEVSLVDFGDEFRQHVFDTETFKDIIESMYTIFENDTFRLLLMLAKTFIESKLSDIQVLLGIHISTEDILHKILVHCLKDRDDLSCSALEEDFRTMLNVLEDYYRSINPNSNREMLKQCEICNGLYAICEI